MIWSRLKRLTCPKCNTGLEHSKAAKRYTCTKKTCDFTISSEKFDEVVRKLYLKSEQGVPQYGDNDAALNNL